MNKKYIKAGYSLIILFQLVGKIVLAQNPTLLEEVIAGIRYNDNLVRDWKAICLKKICFEKNCFERTSGVTKEGNISEEIQVWAQKGEKIYKEEKDLVKNTSKNISTFNGEILNVWGSNNKAFIKVPTEKDLYYTFFDTVCPLHLFQVLRYRNKPLIIILEEEKERITTNLSEENINGYQCYLLEITWRGGEIKDYRYEYKLWIDYQRGFRPIKMIEVFKDKNGKPLLKSIIDTQYEKFADNIWFPVKGKIEGLVYEKGDISLHNTYEITLRNIEINKGIPDSFFQIQFPKGTKVNDKRTGVNYIIP